MQNIALVTCSKYPDLTENDRILISLFQNKNFEVAIEIWDNPEVNWEKYDLVLIRSTWDYYLKIDEFKEWVSSFRNSKSQFLNPSSIVLNNFHKFYLHNLIEKGISVIPTLFSFQELDLEMLKSWNKIVVKPAVSAGSYLTEIWDRKDINKQQLENKIKEGDWLFQPFMEEITELGEISLIFFGGKFSHAIQKIPRKGDFRVQKQFGSTYTPYIPSKQQLETAKNILTVASEKTPLYARVDGILKNSEFLLMEIEMIEPDLYFEHSNGSAERFVNTLIEYIGYK
jgi:glutathione synthase/RimK-type ligase-like ATP-grasp enzyme